MLVRRGAANILILASCLACFGAALTMPQVQQKKAAPVELINFSRDILPILSDKCFKCHGPDSQGRQANMRLDVPEGAFENRSGKFPIVPSKPEHSLVVERMNDKDSPMPPEDSGKTLTKAEIALITRWIAEGAKFNKLWSFEPLPSVVHLPAGNSPWIRDDIDRFILARLNREGLTPSAEAPRLRWLRRVTYDLTGLPPSEEEVKAFEDDSKEGAYERVVSRLLASPRFGERLAVDWLDAARYSDSYGYQSDLLSPTWPYRDWVIKAFNQNQPYDQFLTDQIAGDLLPNATRDQRLATAFNRLHRQSNEGGSIALEYKTTYASDRVETYGTAVLGLTIGCARCHDHKFDPISQKDYYQLFAYFNNIKEYGLLLSTEIVPTPSLLLPNPEQEANLTKLRVASEAADANVRKTRDEADSRLDTWLTQKPEQPSITARFSLDSLEGDKYPNQIKGNDKIFGNRIGNAESVPGQSGQALKFDGDNGVVFRGLPARERWDPFTWSFWIEDPRPNASPIVLLHRTGGTDVGFCGFDLILEDGFLTARVMRHWPGNAVAIRTKTQIPKSQWTHIGWSWDGSSKAAGLKLFVNGKLAATSVVADKIWKKINAYGDLGPSGHEWSFAQRFREAGFKGGKLDDVAFADRELSPIEVANLYDGKALANAFENPSLYRSQLRELFIASVDSEARTSRDARQKAQVALTQAEEGVYEISVMEEANPPIPAYLLARGAYDAPRTDQNLVQRNVPKQLPRLNTTGPNNRLALAKWTTDPNHPLTSRVAVNRIWQMLFGNGLVESSENFGVQGSRPTHPELLDFLARRFVNSDWNVKSLIKSIVLSATYRQDSVRTAKATKLDPDNRLLSRGPSQRLPAEMIRDTVLAASGLLTDKLGGPPVNPYQPAGLWQEFNTMTNGFVQSKGPDLYRRSLYSTWKRTTPVPSMIMFDATSREACAVKRPSTNTPLQALVLLNDVQFVEAARVLAELVMKQKSDSSTRIKEAFLRLAGREPDTRESAILEQTYSQQKAEFVKAPTDATKLIAVGDSKADSKLNPIELAAMTVTVQAILNSDSVIWKR